ncbi:RNA-directed DNA polymerase from mobile element jockey-like [Brachionus plicatilis]|uniref:RNA-directed DNA polymerase from mobile element jockey-like n=1 Tax=Brachionus plicatilis TaxID=10195 RepID=A0A3M7SR12_BRAPC|nr:RNA-directed DNA polymerase from mobile element jockey-like [Brachionus plicatilis]
MLEDKFRAVSEAICDRIRSIKINRLVILNVYLPHYDKKNSDLANEFIATTMLMYTTIDSMQAAGYDVLVAGDFNIDFLRCMDKPSHVKTLVESMTRLSMIPIDIMKRQVVAYTYVDNNREKPKYKWLDHMWVSSKNTTLVRTVRITDIRCNTSDHLPILMKYDLNSSEKFTKTERTQKIRKPRLDHEMQHIRSQYSQLVQKSLKDNASMISKLEEIKTPEDVRIVVGEVLDALSNYILKAVECVDKKSTNLLPNGAHIRKLKPRWDDTLTKLHDDVCKTYVNYRDSGYKNDLKPPFQKAKVSFRRYRRLREIEHHNLKLKELNKFFLFLQIITCPLADIRDAYKKIFTNRKQSDVDERNVLNKLKEHLERVESESPKFKLEYGEMKDVISTLKNGKSRGMSNISNEMIKYCDSKLLIKTLQICYGKMNEYSRVPTNFNISIIKPLIKDHKSPSNTINNLRPVAISDVYSVMFEKILLGRIKLESKEHDKQFGFKQNSSCAHAVFILKQVMNLCKQKKRSLYVLAVDLTKAFDKFFRPLLWLNMFKRVVIELDDERSDVFRTLLGVKQGGPTLFNFIAHQIIVEIEQLGIGVTVGKQLVNIIGYADDTLLIANKSSNMIKMIRVLEETTKKNEIEINVKKTFMMSTDKSNLVFDIFGNKIENTTQIKYLGSEISMNGTAKLTSEGLLNELVSPQVKARLHSMFIKSILFYGLENINLNGEQINLISATDGNIIQKMLYVPASSKTTELLASLVKSGTSLDSLDLQVERELNKNEAESAEFRCSSLMVIRVKEILLIQSPREPPKGQGTPFGCLLSALNTSFCANSEHEGLERATPVRISFENLMRSNEIIFS